MNPDGLDSKIHALLEDDLNLEAGEMMTTLNVNEIDTLFCDIRNLVNESVREAAR